MNRAIALTSAAALVGLSTVQAEANPALILVAPMAMHGIAAGTAAAIGLGAFGAGALVANGFNNGGWYGYGGCGWGNCAYGAPYGGYYASAPIAYGGDYDGYVDGGEGYYGGYGGPVYGHPVYHHHYAHVAYGYAHVATHCYHSWRGGVPVRVCVTPVW